ncbi:hypothetical protein FRC01_001051 [Tulasnella sp. 417]|nr:hypothetical protein FRC01_001051 [Tulasnella sp. 417]
MTSDTESSKYIVWLDIDNTLYPPSMKIHDLMAEKIYAYFRSLDLDAETLANRYYMDYGLALRGLIRHHQIEFALEQRGSPLSDPLDFDRKCDGALPLDDILKPNPDTIQLLKDFDREKTRVWALTNAYKDHANRVLKVLGLSEHVEGVVFCDYPSPDFSCKPEPEFYQQALKQAGVKDPSKCYFIDDSLKNVVAAKKLGWGSCVLYRESTPDLSNPVVSGGDPSKTGIDATITSLQELRTVWSHLFKNDRA